ncbi:hypothetical protein pb186bvf_014370 [Paramecium bursaria]
MDDQRLERVLKDDFKSSFLELDDKSYILDAKDPLGPRLKDWQPGDNVLSVTFKRMKNIIYDTLNPKTYEKSNLKKMRFYYEMYNVYFVLTFTMFLFPASIFLSTTLPRIQRAKRQFYMHQYDKMNLLYRAMGLKQKEKPKFKDLKQQLHQKEEY